MPEAEKTSDALMGASHACVKPMFRDDKSHFKQKAGLRARL